MFDGGDKGAGKRGDSAEPLDEVQGGAFAGEENARRAADHGDFGARLEAIARLTFELDIARSRREFFKDQRNQLDAGQGQGLAGEHAAYGAQPRGDAKLGGDIAGADILQERAAHQLHGLLGKQSEQSLANKQKIHDKAPWESRGLERRRRRRAASMGITVSSYRPPGGAGR